MMRFLLAFWVGMVVSSFVLMVAANIRRDYLAASLDFYLFTFSAAVASILFAISTGGKL